MHAAWSAAYYNYYIYSIILTPGIRLMPGVTSLMPGVTTTFRAYYRRCTGHTIGGWAAERKKWFLAHLPVNHSKRTT
jgi:hypothetical protein